MADNCSSTKIEWYSMSTLAESIDQLWTEKVQNSRIDPAYGCKCTQGLGTEDYRKPETLVPLMHDTTTPFFLGMLLPDAPRDYYLRFEYGYPYYGQNPVLLRTFLVDGPMSSTPVENLEPVMGTPGDSTRLRTQEALKNLREVRMGKEEMWDPYREKWTERETTPELFIATDEDTFPCICKSIFRLAPMHQPVSGGSMTSSIDDQISDAYSGKNIMNPYMFPSDNLWDYSTIASLSRSEYGPRFDEYVNHDPWTPQVECGCQTVTLPKIGQVIDPTEKSNDIIQDNYFYYKDVDGYAGYNWGNHSGPEKPIDYNYTNTYGEKLWDSYKHCEKDLPASVFLQFEKVSWPSPYRESVVITAAVRRIPARVILAVRRRWINMLWERLALITGRRLFQAHYRNSETPSGNPPIPGITYAQYVNRNLYTEGNSFTSNVMGQVVGKCQCYRYAGRETPAYPGMPPTPPSGFYPEDPPDGGWELGTYVGIMQDENLGNGPRGEQWGGIRTDAVYSTPGDTYCLNFRFQRYDYEVRDWAYQVQLPWDRPVPGGPLYDTENPCPPGAECTESGWVPINTNPLNSPLPWNIDYFTNYNDNPPLEYYPNRAVDPHGMNEVGNVTPIDLQAFKRVQAFEYTLSYMNGLVFQIRSQKAREGTEEGACRFQFYGFGNGFYSGCIDVGRIHRLTIEAAKGMTLYFWVVVPYGVGSMSIRYDAGLEGTKYGATPCAPNREGSINWYGSTGEIGQAGGVYNYGQLANGREPGAIMTMPIMMGNGACRRFMKYMVGELWISPKTECSTGKVIPSTVNLSIIFS